MEETATQINKLKMSTMAIFSGNNSIRSFDSLSLMVNPSILRLIEEDKVGMFSLSPFFSNTPSPFKSILWSLVYRIYLFFVFLYFTPYFNLTLIPCFNLTNPQFIPSPIYSFINYCRIIFVRNMHCSLSEVHLV